MSVNFSKWLHTRVLVCEFACVSIWLCVVPVWLCVHTYDDACHVETCDSETRCVCVCVTRRLVATGGGKQADLYSFDQPGGRGWAVGGSRKVKGKKWKGKCLFQDQKCVLLGESIYRYRYLYLCPSIKSSFTSASGTMPCMSALLM